MNPYAAWPRSARVALVLFIIIATTFILREAEEVLVPLVLAILLSFLLHPVVKRLQRVGVHRVVAVLFVVGLMAVLTGGLGFVVSSQIKTLADDIPNHKDKIQHRVLVLKRYMKGGTVDRLERMIVGVNAATEQKIDAEAAALNPNRGTDQPIHPELKTDDSQRSLPAPAAATHEPSSNLQRPTSGFAGGIVLSAVDLLTHGGIVILLVIFFLIQQSDIRDRFVSVAGRGALATTTKALEDAGSRISRYLLMQFAINAAFGISVCLGLVAMRVPYAVMWGLCAGIFRYIPYVGAWIAAVLPISTSLMLFDGWTTPIMVFSLFLVLELICGNVLEPILYGHSVGLSEVGVILAAIAWAWVWGPVGLMLATPMTACLVVLGKYVPGLKIFDYMLGDRPPVGPPMRLYQRLLAKDDEDAEDLIEEYLKDHSLIETADELIVPSIELLHQDVKGQRIDEDDAAWIQATLENHITDLDVLARKARGRKKPAKEEPLEPSGSETIVDPSTFPVVVGLATHSQDETLILQVMAEALAGAPCRFEIISADLLMSERVAKAAAYEPVAICVSALPPGDLPYTRQLCKRLKQAAPDSRILVGRWAPGGKSDREENLRSAGADDVVTTVSAMSGRIEALAQMQRAANSGPAAAERTRPAATVAV